MTEQVAARAAHGRVPVETSGPEDTPRRSQKPRFVLLAADLIVAQIFCLLALQMANRVGLGASPASESLAIGLALTFPLVVGISGLYRRSHLSSWRTQAEIGLRVLAWFVALTVGLLFLFADTITWDLRKVLFLYQGMMAVWLLALRPPAGALLSRVFAPPRVDRILVVGSDRVARNLARGLRKTNRHAQIVGFASTEGKGGAHVGPLFHTDLEGLPQLADELEVDLVVVARPNLPREEIVRLSEVLARAGRRVHVVSNVFNQLVDNVPFETDNGVPLIPVGEMPISDADAGLKRIFDIVATTAGGILISPVLLLIAILVRFSSPGPILFRQERVGRGGRKFWFYKFRTMAVQNDDSGHREYVVEMMKGGDAAAVDKDGKKFYKLVDDPRVTSIGRFLRRTSLDELPQLINVLRGEMTLIGPRPCLPFEYDLYKDWQRKRLDVTPGMTGLWQVTGRSYVSFEDMVLLDLFYIANWSFGMDLKILLRTIPVVIWGKGGV